MNKSNIYSISKKEIKRRITAYTTLIVTFLLSLIIFAIKYITLYLDISLFIIIALAIFLLGSRMILIRYFNKALKSKIIINSKYIERDSNKYLIEGINLVNIKRTSKGYLREIKIVFNNKKTIYINGIDDFEELNKHLQKYLPKKTIIKKINEPLDYDHPTFYFFFGLLVSFVSFQLAKFLMALNFYQLQGFYYITAIFTMMMGIYFIMSKPLYKRDEKNNQKNDYLFGITFIVLGFIILIVNI